MPRRRHRHAFADEHVGLVRATANADLEIRKLALNSLQHIITDLPAWRVGLFQATLRFLQELVAEFSFELVEVGLRVQHKVA